MNISDLIMARYREGGRGPDTYDCFGLFAELCRRRGQPIPEMPSPEDLPDRQLAIMKETQKHWIKLENPEPGCAVLFRIGAWISHLGMVLDGGRFIHANKINGITVTRLDNVLWAQRIAGFYRFGGSHD